MRAVVAARAAAVGMLAALIAMGAASSLRPAPVSDAGDGFWSALHVEAVFQGHGSLEALIDASPVIVVGRMIEVRRSKTVQLVPEWGEDGEVAFSTVAVAIDEAIRVPDGVKDSLEFDLFVADPSLTGFVASSLPREPLLLFLTSDAEGMRLTSPVSYVTNQGDAIKAPVDADEPWLTALEGRSFPKLVGDVRSVLSGG